jgi:hypothetical protein
VRTVHKKPLIMPAKVEAADGIRKMLGWDKSLKAGEPDDDISELLIMIRRNSSHASALPLKNEGNSGYPGHSALYEQSTPTRYSL